MVNITSLTENDFNKIIAKSLCCILGQYNIYNEEDSIILDDEFDYDGYNSFIGNEYELYNHKE